MDLSLPRSRTTDAEVQRFIVEGYAIVQPESLPSGFHEEFIEMADALEPQVLASTEDAPEGIVCESPIGRNRSFQTRLS